MDDLNGDLALRQAAYDASQELFRSAQDINAPGDHNAIQVPMAHLTTKERLQVFSLLRRNLPLHIDLLTAEQRHQLGDLLHQAGVRKVQEGDALLPHKVDRSNRNN